MRQRKLTDQQRIDAVTAYLAGAGSYQAAPSSSRSAPAHCAISSPSISIMGPTLLKAQ